MDCNSSAWIRGLLVFCVLLVSGCAGYSGSNLKPGVSTRPEVLASMGEPALAWKNPDGSEQLAYPRGPASTQTFMAYVGPDGRLQRIEKALDPSHFARVRAGMSKDQVLRVLGPPGPAWTEFYSRRNELAWSWLFCNDRSVEEFFDVMFDATTGIVRSTATHPNLVGPDGIQPVCGR
ncbi:MAG: hypothetical protein FIA96_05045 [Betaproteobacteria bacterium]|nr:hypothetical protein [Betaproteobacteria bacterium]